MFLDEPTTGFDPSARRAAWDMVAGLRTLGVTVFLTTHYMEEAERLADRVAVVVEGRIVAEGTPGSLAGRDLAAVESVLGSPRALARKTCLARCDAPWSDGTGTAYWCGQLRRSQPSGHWSAGPRAVRSTSQIWRFGARA